jgi:hypothetical protein
MPRKAALVPNEHIHTTIPRALHQRLTAHLTSELEGKVPAGALQKFFVGRIYEFFNHRSLDLSPFLGSMPGEFVVQGSAESIEQLTNLLRKETA